MAAVSFKAAIELVKDQPGTGDVHVSSAGGADPLKAKRRKARLYAQIAARNLGDGGVDKYVKIEKVDDKLGMVFGYAIICKENGVDYYDVQDDHIPEDAMLKAAGEFAAGARDHKEMHTGEENGQWLFLFPMTSDIAKAFNMSVPKTGLLVGFKPAPDVLAKFKSGEYTGFSIGGERVKDEEVN